MEQFYIWLNSADENENKNAQSHSIVDHLNWIYSVRVACLRVFACMCNFIHFIQYDFEQRHTLQLYCFFIVYSTFSLSFLLAFSKWFDQYTHTHLVDEHTYVQLNCMHCSWNVSYLRVQNIKYKFKATHTSSLI